MFAIFIISILVCIITIIVYIYQHKLLNKEKILKANEKLVHIYQDRIKENQIQIEKKERETFDMTGRIADKLKQQNDELEKENKNLLSKINQCTVLYLKKSMAKETIRELKIKNMQFHVREEYLTKRLVEHIEILNKLKNFSPKKSMPVSWDQVYVVMDDIFNKFVLRLKRQFPNLTESDLQLCCLIKLNLSVTEIAKVRNNIQPASVSTHKQKLKTNVLNQLKLDSNSKFSLDKWIHDF